MKMKIKIGEKLRQTTGKTALTLKEHSPEILIVGGIVGVVVSAVMACKSTTKISEILEETKANVAMIHDCAADEGLGDRYTDEDAKRDLTIVYAKAGWNLVKLYAPAVILGGLSIAGIVASNNILKKRNVALAAAYTTVDKGFKEYRSRVIERFGEEVDKELRYDIKAKKITETEIDPETGKEKNVKKTIGVSGNVTDYACWFDRTNPNWEGNMDYNMMFLRAEQNYANDLLRARKHLFLNEVYDMLGMPRTKAGQIVGWIYDPNNPKTDDYVDFRIFETYKENGDSEEPAILLDFNVEGAVLNRFEGADR